MAQLSFAGGRVTVASGAGLDVSQLEDALLPAAAGGPAAGKDPRDGVLVQALLVRPVADAGDDPADRVLVLEYSAGPQGTAAVLLVHVGTSWFLPSGTDGAGRLRFTVAIPPAGPSTLFLMSWQPAAGPVPDGGGAPADGGGAPADDGGAAAPDNGSAAADGDGAAAPDNGGAAADGDDDTDLDAEAPQTGAEPPQRPSPAPPSAPSPAPSPSPSPRPRTRAVPISSPPPAGTPRPRTRSAGRPAPPVEAAPEPPPEHEPPPAGAAPPEAGQETIGAFAAADMPPLLEAGKPVRVNVRIARDRPSPAAGQRNEVQPVALAATRKVTVKLRRTNLTVVAGTPDRFVLDVPAPGETVGCAFQVVGGTPGEAEATVVLTQDSTFPLAVLSLRPTVRAVGPPAGTAPLTVATLWSRPDPELNRYPVLSIDEDLVNGAATLEFILDLHDDVRRSYDKKELPDKAAYLDGLYTHIEDLWDECRELPSRDERNACFEGKLQGYGRELFKEFFPLPLREALWANRERIRDLAIVGTETQIPWELLCLTDPAAGTAADPNGAIFLGERGLTRMVLDVAMPRALTARAGRIHCLCPAYEDPELVLADSGAEALFLNTALQALLVDPADAPTLAGLLRSNGVDLLHFTGHGLQLSGPVPEQRMLLSGYKPRSPAAGSYYSAAELAKDLPPRPPQPGAPPGPIVVLNACGLGRTARTGADTFAALFLRGGASVFVGCLWSVRDQPARVFAETFYGELRAGKTLAAATIAARQRARADGDASWLAYTVYGNPLAQVAFG